MLINGIFEYNQHWVAMMNIINRTRLNPPHKEGHLHHIIPRCWFKLKNLDIDNSDKNLVLLSYDDHVKVHKLMYLCTTGIMKGKMAYAYLRLTEGKIVENGCFNGENNPFFGKTPWNKGKKHSKESIKKMSELKKGEKNPNFGKPRSDDTRRKISEAQKGKEISEEHRLKISEANKGRTPWNKGKKSKPLSDETRKKMSKLLKGMTWKLIDGKRVWLPKE